VSGAIVVCPKQVRHHSEHVGPCGADIVSRERRPDGYHRCAVGHSFRPSEYPGAGDQPVPVVSAAGYLSALSHDSGGYDPGQSAPSVMRSVWKYELREHLTTLRVPSGARFLHVAWQPPAREWFETKTGRSDVLATVWLEVDPAADEREVVLQVVGTGAPEVDRSCMDYLGTAVTPTGFVWHVYERGA